MAKILCWSREERIDDFRKKLNVSPRIFTHSYNEPGGGLLVLVQWSQLGLLCWLEPTEAHLCDILEVNHELLLLSVCNT